MGDSIDSIKGPEDSGPLSHSEDEGIMGSVGTFLEEEIKIVCISDTHGIHKKIPYIPKGDILIHGGDFSNVGEYHQIVDFIEWLHSLPFMYKIFIAGNHDKTIHESYYDRISKNYRKREPYTSKQCREYLSKYEDVIYLEDSAVNLEIPSKINLDHKHNIKVYGSPWQPFFCDWAFNLHRGEEILKKWRLIPADTDILITHGPPYGYGDLCYDGFRAGCVDLLNEINNRIHPRLHIFGHIHEEPGAWQSSRDDKAKSSDEMDDTTTTLFVNASTCDLRYRASNPPIVVNYPYDAKRPPYTRQMAAALDSSTDIFS